MISSTCPHNPKCVYVYICIFNRLSRLFLRGVWRSSRWARATLCGKRPNLALLHAHALISNIIFPSSSEWYQNHTYNRWVRRCSPGQEILIATKWVSCLHVVNSCGVAVVHKIMNCPSRDGYASRFAASDITSTGRTSRGVKVRTQHRINYCIT